MIIIIELFYYVKYKTYFNGFRLMMKYLIILQPVSSVQINSGS